MEKNSAIIGIYDTLKDMFIETSIDGVRYLTLLPPFNRETETTYRFETYAIREDDEVSFDEETRHWTQPLYVVSWDIDRDELNARGWYEYVEDFVWDEIEHIRTEGSYILNTAKGLSEEGEEFTLTNPYVPHDFLLPTL
ncbi:MAG: hypothetical protein ACOX41_05640 [Anaerovoracaceae bacterium]|jgi:hypothetical protein